MSVATRTTHIITCDRAGCTRSVKSNYNLDTAKASALRQNWQISYHPDWDGGVDYCAEHKETSHHGDYTTDSV